MSRLLDFYLASAARVYAIERPGDRTVDHLEPTDHAGQDFSDDGKALDWLHSEAACILACVQQALVPGMLRRAVDLLLASKDLAESGASSIRYEAAAGAARDAAATAGDAHAEGRARVSLAQVLSKVGRFDEAAAELERAAELALTSQDPWTSGNAPNEQGIVTNCIDQPAVSETHLLKAIHAFRSDGNRPGEASALCNLARALVSLGRTSKAIELAQQAMAIYDDLGLTFRLANARYTLGVVLIHAGRHQEALEELSASLEVFKDNRQRLWEGTTHFRIAQALWAARQGAQSARHAEQALSTGCVGGEWMRANVLTLLGQSLDSLGQVDRARACWQEALAIHDAASAPEAAQVRRLLKPMAVACQTP
jgi:tetratricopeptide (TPR) repeat protein